MVAGNLADLAFGIQSAKGTAVVPSSTNTMRCLVAGGWLTPVQDSTELEETGTSRLRTQAYRRMVRAGGSPQFFARPEMIGGLLYAALGAKATTGAADPYTHTFTPAATQPYMTWWASLGASVTEFESFIDCKLVSLRIESSAGNPLRATAEITGISPTYETPYPPTAIVVETAAPFLHMDGQGTLKVEGAAVSAIDNFVLTIATGVTAAQGDDYIPDSINEGMLDITVETGQTLSDFALWRRLHFGSATPTDGATARAAAAAGTMELAGSPAGIDFLFTRVAASPGPERSLELALPRLRVRDMGGAEPNTGGAPLRRTVTYGALLPTSGAAMTATLKNGRSGY
jgi:Phage tail tube protein